MAQDFSSLGDELVGAVTEAGAEIRARREAAPALDPEFTAWALLATLHPTRHLQAREGLGWPVERLRAGWHALVAALTGED